MKKIILTALLFPLMSWAHGEDKLGPNKGYIKMPGAFHTEVILAKDNSVHMFLLDMDFKNPTIQDSTAMVTYKNGKTSVPFKCEAMNGNHFHCIPEKKFSANKGELVIQATRKKAVGNEAIYKLPLKLTNAPSDSDHHHH